jgi:hypothetical protein
MVYLENSIQGEFIKMKKLVFFRALVCVIAGSASFYTGCASSPVYLVDHSPLAIVSITGNPALPWKDSNQSDEDADDGNGVLTNMVNKIVDANNPEQMTGQNRIDYAERTLRELLEQNGGVHIIPHDQVISSKTYSETTADVFTVLDSAYPATGFKSISRPGAKRARLIMEESGAHSMLLADFFFQKVNTNGNKWTGKVGAAVTMNVTVLNDRGRVIVTHQYYATSPEQISISGRKYDKNALVDLFPATIDAVINQFIVSYVK